MKNLIRKEDLINLFDEKKIPYVLNNHAALYSVKDSQALRGKIEGLHTKNLFLKNKKNEYFLFSCLENLKFDIKKISKSINLGNISFANEDKLKLFLGLVPGSVTPFGLLNDKDRVVNFYLDNKIYTSNKINFHPMVNTSTITLKVADFINFMIENNININILDYDNYLIIKRL